MSLAALSALIPSTIAKWSGQRHRRANDVWVLSGRLSRRASQCRDQRKV